MTEPIDLGGLPAPDIIQALDFETIVSELKQLLLEQNADYADMLALESEPLTIAIQAFAYRELLLRQRINEAIRSNLLAFATHSDLEQLGAFYGVSRQIGEADTPLRQRIKDRILGSSTAGGEAHYRYQAFSVSTDIRDIAVDSPEPGRIRVSVLAKTGIPVEPLIEKVKARVTAPDVKVLTDTLDVVPTDLVEVDVVADIIPERGGQLVSADIIAAAFADEVERERHLGWDFAPSWIIKQLHGSNVQEVQLHSPASNVVIQPNQCIAVRNLSLNILPSNS